MAGKINEGELDTSTPSRDSLLEEIGKLKEENRNLRHGNLRVVARQRHSAERPWDIEVHGLGMFTPLTINDEHEALRAADHIARVLQCELLVRKIEIAGGQFSLTTHSFGNAAASQHI
jgi:hypothetical protein